MNTGSNRSMIIYTAILAFICFFMLKGYVGEDSPKVEKYTNDHFGFELSYPETWTVAGDEDAMRRESLARAASEDPSSVVAADFEVFSVAKFSGRQTRMRLSVRASPMAPEIYLDRSLGYLKRHPALGSLEDVNWSYGDTISGREFTVLKWRVVSPAVTLRQEAYATCVPNGSLMFGLLAASERELEELRRVVRTLRFE